MRTITTYITKVEHGGTSASGNPWYKVTTQDGDTYRTSADSAVNYVITNSDMGGSNQVALTLDEKSHIRRVEPTGHQCPSCARDLSYSGAPGHLHY